MKRLTKEEWRNRVSSFLKTDKTQAQWSRENNMDPKQLSYWVRKFRKNDASIKQSKENRFIKANIVKNKLIMKKDITVKIGDVEIEVNPGFNKELLVEIIEALKAVS